MKLKPVSFLLCLCHAGSAAALGLGEISVRSSLGQPLHAAVAIIGVTPTTRADCFSLDASPASIAPPLQAQLDLEQTGGLALLHIRTPRAIHDPVTQFVLVSDCEARLQREYVVLLDPPERMAPVIPETATAAAQTASARPAPRAARQGQRKQQPAAVARLAADRTLAAPSERKMQSAARPRLVLSGRHGAAPFALRLDTSLPDMTRPLPEGLTATELSDENTALSRKLAHLETQLAALQQRNAQLEAAAKPAARHAAAPAAVAPPAADPSVKWPLVLLAAGLLAAGAALVAWLLRRNRRPQPVPMDDTPWTQQPALASKVLPDMAPMPAEERSFPIPERMSEIAPPPRSEDTEVNEDILDQAEVFMAHGHGELAVNLLQEHLRAAPTESPVPWLLLLDLLHREGDTAGYAAASAECRRYFNVNLSDHPVSQDNDKGLGLEAYPHLLEQLVRVWNTPEIGAFFDNLICDNRGGTRMGFEPGAYRDILLLRAIAQDSFLAA